jgi:hypothetical protein
MTNAPNLLPDTVVFALVVDKLREVGLGACEIESHNLYPTMAIRPPRIE